MKNLFANLFSALNREKVRYLVVGGVAVNLYGIERATGDVDLVLDLSRDNLERFLKAARKLNMQPKVPVKLEEFADPEKRREWREEKGMLVFSLFDPDHPYFLLDIFSREPFDFPEAVARRTEVDFAGIHIPLASPGDLISLKTGTGRPQDESDIYFLSQLQEDRLKKG